MIIHDLQVLHNVPFDEYLLMPGTSYSTIKSEGKQFNVTSKMRLGTDIHSYLSNRSSIDPANSNYKLIVMFAGLVEKELGALVKYIESEVVVTCLMEFGGFVMKYKGRIDIKIRNLLIIDPKFANDIDSSAAFFGYDHQIEGYCIPFGIKNGILLGVSPTTIDKNTGKNKIKRRVVECKHWWWEQQVAKLGRKINLTTIKK